MANMMADRLRETEEDLRHAREAFDFKCQEVEKLNGEIKRLRTELASLKNIQEKKNVVYSQMKMFLLKELLDDEAVNFLVERIFKK